LDPKKNWLVEKKVFPDLERKLGMFFLAVSCPPDTRLNNGLFMEEKGVRIFASNPEKKWKDRWLMVEGETLGLLFCSATRCSACRKAGWISYFYGVHTAVGMNPCHLKVAIDSAAERWLNADDQYSVCQGGGGDHVAAFQGTHCPHCGRKAKVKAKK
jgi:hypothetical protein